MRARLDPLPDEVTERGTSRSAVSRRFVALSAKRLGWFLSRPLGELDLRVVCIDGKVSEVIALCTGQMNGFSPEGHMQEERRPNGRHLYRTVTLARERVL